MCAAAVASTQCVLMVSREEKKDEVDVERRWLSVMWMSEYTFIKR